MSRTFPAVLSLVVLFACEANEADTADTSTTGESDADTDADADSDSDVDADHGGVRGRVYAPNESTPVPAATVRVLAGDEEYDTQTDAAGEYELDGLPVGEAMVLAEKGSFSGSTSVFIEPGVYTEVDGPYLASADLRIAVVDGAYDDIGSILASLGVAYTPVEGSGRDLLIDPAALGTYDVVMLNCGMDFYSYSPDDMALVSANLRDFVAAGGSVYSSDWAYWWVENAWPDLVDFTGDDAVQLAAATGVAQTYTFDVVDEDVRTVLGGEPTAEITYDLGSWITATAAGPDGNVLLSGTYQQYGDTGYESAEGPIAVMMHEDGGGTVVWTSFHNEPQVTEDILALLEHFVFSM